MSTDLDQRTNACGLKLGEGDWYPLPNDWLEVVLYRTTPAELVVLQHLVRWWTPGSNGVVWRSSRMIAKDLGLHLTTVKRALKKIRDEGFIQEIKSATKRDAPRYSLNDLPRVVDDVRNSRQFYEGRMAR